MSPLACCFLVALLFKAELHPAVATMPPNAEASIETVARYIAAHELDPLQRIKALHDYVADRIAYDVRALAGDVPLEDAYPEDVFRNRKGVCAGYARLLENLGAAIGIPIRTVHGMTRMGPHAWNAVLLAGRWYEIDATWDAGNVVYNRFIKEYSTKYLFFSHRPDHGSYTIQEELSDDYSPRLWRVAEATLRAREARFVGNKAWDDWRQAAETARITRLEALGKELGL